MSVRHNHEKRSSMETRGGSWRSIERGTLRASIMEGLQEEISRLQEHVCDLLMMLVLKDGKSTRAEAEHPLLSQATLDAMGKSVQFLKSANEENLISAFETRESLVAQLKSSQCQLTEALERIRTLEEEKKQLRASLGSHRLSSDMGVPEAVQQTKAAPTVASPERDAVVEPVVAVPSGKKDSLSSSRKVVVLFSGFKENHPVYNLDLKLRLIEAVRQLGGETVNSCADEELSGTKSPGLTHLVSPPTVRTIKTLAASLVVGVWRVLPEWVFACARTKTWVDEARYGVQTTELPIQGKRVLLDESFLEECEANPAKMSNCVMVVEKLGKGNLFRQGEADGEAADFVLIGAGGESRKAETEKQKVWRWNQFLDYIQHPVVEPPDKTGRKRRRRSTEAISLAKKQRV